MGTGEVSEWLKVPLSKSGVAQVTVGSNPTLSASTVTLPSHYSLKEHTMAVSHIPSGYRTVTPFLVTDQCAALIDFMQRAFDATTEARMEMPGGMIAHAEVRIGDSMIMTSDGTPEFPAQPAMIHLYVENTDALYQKAVAAGARSVREPADQFYGDRNATVVDPCGNTWAISTHIEDVSHEEIGRRAAALHGQH